MKPRTFRSDESVRFSCVALGNFDGIHVGHQAILARCVEDARKEGLVPTIWTFRRHPEHFLKGIDASGSILSPEEKLALAGNMGIRRYFAEDFEAVRDLSPRAFCEKVLFEKLDAREVVCGFNFRFGKNGAGDTALLKELMESAGRRVVVIPAVEIAGQIVSSTRIRRALEEGDVELCRTLLGRPYSILFPVEHGKRLGTRLGFPTLNQSYPVEYVVPKKGVYAVRVFFDNERYNGVCNVGIRPTVSDSGAITAETHLFGFSGELYGKTVRVEFHRFLRAERKFQSLEDLKDQIARDKSDAERYFAERKQP